MAPIVVPQELPGKENAVSFNSPKILDLTTAVLHYGNDIGRGITGAMTIQQNIPLNTGAAAFGKSLGKFLGDSAILVKILGKGDGRFGLFNIAQHDRKRFYAIEQNVDFVSAHDRCIGVRFDGAKKAGLTNDNLRDLPDRQNFRTAEKRKNYQKPITTFHKSLYAVCPRDIGF